ncbi:MAG: DUF4342 domain-containing protein [Clostridia bacterium]|nr:DUF4342 domain-containing protein [Clostridia bacterium]
MDIKQEAEKIVEKVKELIHDGSASRVMLVRGGETLLNLSLNTGVIGAAVALKFAPLAVLTAALVSFGMDCDILVEKKDGTIWSLSETPAGYKLEEIRQKAKSVFRKGDDAAADFAEEPAADAAEPDAADAPEEE